MKHRRLVIKGLSEPFYEAFKAYAKQQKKPMTQVARKILAEHMRNLALGAADAQPEPEPERPLRPKPMF